LFCCCKQETKKTIPAAPTQKEDSIQQKEDVSHTVNHNKTATELYLDSLGFIDIKEKCPEIIIDLKYATEDNFTGNKMYLDLNSAYLHPLAFEKLVTAEKMLKKENPHLRLLVYDAARPLSVQKEMYDTVKDTKFRAYVADPSRTSLHNYGLAIDLTLCDTIGNPLDMGTAFDYFGKLAGIQDEESFIRQKLLTEEQVKNRRLLRTVMQQAGFTPIRGEWWHFNATSLNEAKRIAKIIE